MSKYLDVTSVRSVHSVDGYVSLATCCAILKAKRRGVGEIILDK